MLGWILIALAGAGELDAALSTRLAARDGVDCAALYEGREAAAVDAALVRIADTVPLPPWTPMRAADCLADRLEVSEPARLAAARWLDDPAVPGLAWTVAEHLDGLPEPIAAPLRAAWTARLEREPRLKRLAGERE